MTGGTDRKVVMVAACAVESAGDGDADRPGTELPAGAGPGLGEGARLAALDRYAVLDTPAEAMFDRIARMAATALRAPMALVSLVDKDRQWFKARHGVAMPQTPRSQAFCTYTIQRDAVFVVPDATADPRFQENPLVTGAPGIRFYAGAPLRTPEGYRLGSVCVIDTVPRPGGLTPEETALLTDLAESAMAELEARRLDRALHDALEERTALLREVHHRVRNNLQGLAALAQATTLRLGEGEARQSIAALTRRIEAMGQVHAHLYRAEALDRVDMRQFLEPLCLALAEGEGNGVTARVEVAPVSLDVDSALAMGLVVAEAFANACRHGYAGGPGAVTVRLRALESLMRLEVSDQGCNPQPANGPGLGITLMGMLAGQLGGRLEVTEAPGYTVRLTCPLPAPRP